MFFCMNIFSGLICNIYIYFALCHYARFISSIKVVQEFFCICPHPPLPKKNKNKTKWSIP